jgi:ribose 5-phosphate isomerase A
MSDDLKRSAAIAALDEIRDDMVVGLGSGSTASIFIRELGARVRSGLKVVGIPTSETSRRIAEEVGVPLTTLGQHPRIDVTVDGADEVSPELDLIKGLGGALVREKIVAHATDRVVIVVDEGKLVPVLGTHTGIPVEVIPFAVDVIIHRLNGWGGQSKIREKNGERFVSDNHNFIIDWKPREIREPGTLEKQLKSVTGIVDSGLFCNVAQVVIVAGSSGIRRITRP